MPKYYVYNKSSGEIVHIHETYDATSGNSVRSSREEVLDLVNENIKRDDLDIAEIDESSYPAAGGMKIDPATKTLIGRASSK